MTAVREALRRHEVEVQTYQSRRPRGGDAWCRSWIQPLRTHPLLFQGAVGPLGLGRALLPASSALHQGCLMLASFSPSPRSAMFLIIQITRAGLSRGSNYCPDLNLASVTPLLSSLGLIPFELCVFLYTAKYCRVTLYAIRQL